MLVKLSTLKIVPWSIVSTHWLQQAPHFYQHVHGNREGFHTVWKGGWMGVLEDKEGTTWLRNCPRLTVAISWQMSSGKSSLCLPCCNSSFTSHSQPSLRAGCWARQTLLWPIAHFFMMEINSSRCGGCPDPRLGVEIDSYWCWPFPARRDLEKLILTRSFGNSHWLCPWRWHDFISLAEPGRFAWPKALGACTCLLCLCPLC